MEIPPARVISFETIITYAIMIVLSAWGGIVHFVRRIRQNKGHVFTFAELIGEICVSSFTGIIVFLLCQAAKIDPLVTAAMVAVSGHLGSRLLFQFDVWTTKKVAGILGVQIEEPSSQNKSE